VSPSTDRRSAASSAAPCTAARKPGWNGWRRSAPRRRRTTVWRPRALAPRPPTCRGAPLGAARWSTRSSTVRLTNPGHSALFATSEDHLRRLLLIGEASIGDREGVIVEKDDAKARRLRPVARDAELQV